MTTKRAELLNTIAKIEDDVLLLFDDRDTAIARNWRNAMKSVCATEKRR
jgi:hypothetical protein